MGEDLTYQLYINGEWTDGTGGDVLTVVNPATEEAIGTVPQATAGDVNRAGVAVSGAATSLAPHSPQNFCPSGFSCRHAGHCIPQPI